MGRDIPDGAFGFGPGRVAGQADVAQEVVIQFREAAAVAAQGGKAEEADEQGTPGRVRQAAGEESGEGGHRSGLSCDNVIHLACWIRMVEICAGLWHLKNE